MPLLYSFTLVNICSGCEDVKLNGSVERCVKLSKRLDEVTGTAP